MNEQQLKELRQLARNVRLPKGVEGRVLEETGSPKQPRDGRRSQRPITRRTLVRVGALAAGTIAALLGADALLGSRERNASAGNWFALTAYAEGIPYAENTVMAHQAISPLGSLGGSTSSGWYAAHGIDLRATGSGIERIAYSIEGDYVSPEGQGGEVFDENRVWFTWNPEAVLSDATPTSFTVSYGDQGTEKNLWEKQLWAAFPSGEELDAIYGQMQTTTESTASHRLECDLRLALERRCAELFSSTTLVMCVTFDDGTTQTKRYAIAPREDFDEVYGAFLDAEMEGVYEDCPDLYTIAELGS